MGAIKSNFKNQQTVQGRPDVRAEFEKLVMNAGAKGSFMVFRLGETAEPLVESTV